MSESSQFSKSERAQLRKLAGTAWEAELCAALKELRGDFQRWEAKFINAFELTDKIHEFHNGISRELYKRYTALKPIEAVGIAVAKGVIDEDALTPQLLEKLATSIEVYRRLFSGSEDVEPTSIDDDV